MTGNGAGDREALRAEIQRTRSELGETVEALAAKADVKARLKDSADQAKDRLKDSAEQAKDRLKDSAEQAKDRLRDSADEARDRLKGSADQARARVRAQAAKVRDQAGQATPRESTFDPGESMRRNPVPWAAVAAGALAAVIVVLVVRGRRR